MSPVMSRFNRLAALAATLAAATLLQGCFERPPIVATQTGYRGTGMAQITNPRIAETILPPQLAAIPPLVPAVPEEGPKARELFKNVQVLGELPAADFLRHMTAIQSWVGNGTTDCTYCHDLTDLSLDTKYTKVVARRMLQMTQNLNTAWKEHTMGTGNTGVTCYTCHRGKALPANLWFAQPGDRAGRLLGWDAGQNRPAASVKLTSLPYDPFSRYLKDDKKIENIRLYGPTALLAQGGTKWGTMRAEEVYGLMMHISGALNVNCTFCHDTSNFATWNGPPQRVKAWYGIRMVGDANANYLTPLTDKFPKERLGAMGDIGKINCATCHQGVNKPLGGTQMAKDYKGLLMGPKLVAALPPPLSDPNRSVLYFGVGSAILQGEQAKGLDQLVATLTANPKQTATISGYHSASGELAANQELAKSRAVNVRNAMVAAGIAEGRVSLLKPVQAEANLVGEDPAARRVEVNVK